MWLLFSGLAEGFGIVTLLPLLQLVTTNNGPAPSTGIGKAILEVFHAVGITPSLEAFLCVIVAGIILKAFFLLIAVKEVGFTVAHVTTDLRLQLIRALLEARWAYFISQPAGHFSNAISSEAVRAASAYQAAAFLIALLIRTAIYASLAIIVSWKIALLGISIGFLLTFALRGLISMARSAGDSQTDLLRSLSARLTDALQGIKPVKAMAREKHLKPLLEAETRGLNEAQERQVMSTQILQTVQEPLVVIMISAGLYALMTYTKQPFSALLLMAFLFHRLLNGIHALQQNYQSITVGESALWSMRKSIQRAELESEKISQDGVPPTLEKEIRLENIQFFYGDKPVLENVTLSIPAGTFTAITGPSGAGKTTIADLIVGLYQPSKGNIFIDGVALQTLRLGDWRHMIGYVPQEMFLFHDSLIHNVTLGDPSIGRVAVEQALRAAGAWHFVSELPDAMDTIIGERGATLSGGQRQRIAIARALARKPKLLILDEITASLDPQSEAEICDALKALRGSATIVSISHQPAMVQAADYIYRLTEGVIERLSPPGNPSNNSVLE